VDERVRWRSAASVATRSLRVELISPRIGEEHRYVAMDSPLPVGLAFSERSYCVRQINMTRQIIATTDELIDADRRRSLYRMTASIRPFCHRRDAHGR